MKKLLTLCAAVLMAFAVTGSAMAADAVTVYVEPANATYTLYTSPDIQARALFLDATGALATTFGGAQIGDSVLEIKSANFASAVTFTPGSPVNIDNSGYQGFTIAYNPAAITEPGDDVITVTLKKGSTTISNVIPIKVQAPAANTYVTRTGIAASLIPEVLEAVPNPQNNNGSIISAGSSVSVTVMAAYGIDTDADNTYEDYIFTDNVPAGLEKVNISGTSSNVTIATSSATLENGMAAVTVEVSDLKMQDIIEKQATAANNATILNNLLDPTVGELITWSASAPTTRSVGNYDNAGIVDANADQVLVEQLTADVGIAFQDTAISNDTSKHKPAPIKLVTIVGLPVNDVTGAIDGIYGADLSASDAYNLLIDAQSKPNALIVQGGGGAPRCGAIVGYDQFKNPAPFSTTPGATQFVLNDSVGALAFAGDTAGNFSVAGGAGVITSATPFSAFLPFILAADTDDVFILSSAITPSIASTFASVDTAAEGVSFAALNTVASFGVNGNPITNLTAGDSRVTITVNAVAPAQGEAFTLRAKTKLGKTVKMNLRDSTTGADSVNIPRDGTTAVAEQDIVYFTRVKQSDGPLFLIYEGKTSKTVVIQKIAIGVAPTDPGIAPADPGDFPPSAIVVTLNTVNAVVDTEHNEIVINNAPFPPIPTVLIFDAFSNLYTPGYVGGPPFDTVTLEDADPTVEVVKADGTTPYPGGKGEVDGNNIIVTLGLSDVTAANGAPVLKITAGAATASITYNVRALVATSLKNTFIPVKGIDDTPIKLNFVDQNGIFVAPNPTSAFEVDVETDGGTTSAGAEFTQILSNAVKSFTFTAELDVASTTNIMTISADGRDADAGSTTLTLDFNADFEKPVVGAVTAGPCSISIAITDNKAVDLAGSPVVVKNGATGEDITSTLTRTNTGDGTTAGSINFTTLGTGSFVLEIVAKDKANNTSAPTTRTIEVTSCVGAECVTVDPAFVRPGDTKDVTITATGSNFVAGTTVAFSCTGITVNSTTINSATELTVNVTAAADAAAADCEITVATGSASLTCDDKFAIVTTLPSCASVSPASVDAGFTGDVTVTLADINLNGATGVAVAFGCGGVTVNSSTVTGATTVKANITVAEAAAGGACDVTVTGGATGSVGIICANAFTVVPIPPCTITVAPTTVTTGILFPRTTNLTITGAGGCKFDSTTTVTISGNVDVQSVKVDSASKLTVTIQTRPVLFGGKGTKTVTVSGVDGTATFTVKGLFF